MPHFVLLTKLSPSTIGDSVSRESIGRDWLKTVKEKCPDVKWLDHYALLGPYDFMDIYEAKDEKVAIKVSMITMAKGAVKAESLLALPYAEYLKTIKEI